MFLIDQHIHSACSPDSETPMRDMAVAAREHGISAVCFTDHLDMDDYVTGTLSEKWRTSWPDIRETGLALMADPPEGIEIHVGMELGEANHDPERARAYTEAPELDFVIGSLHNLKDTTDFYYIDYQSEEECRNLNALYLAELRQLAELDFFDVVGHIGYTTRYMRRKGFYTSITAGEHREVLTEIFRLLIRKGQGIEVNCSGIRAGGESFPNASVLGLYRELGGEIITVGSDAHNTADAGIGIREGYELLQSLGYRYVAQFKKRKPIFLPL